MIITIPGHFACSSFAMHRHLTAAPPVRTVPRDNGPRQVVLVCPRFACSTRRRNRAAPSHSCRSLLRVISALSRRPQNDHADAGFIGNGPRGQLCKMIARMIVDDGASLDGRERSTALRGKGVLGQKAFFYFDTRSTFPKTPLTGSKSMQIHASAATAAKPSEQDAALSATRSTLEENVCNVCVCVRE